MRRRIGVIVAIAMLGTAVPAQAQMAQSLEGVWRVTEVSVTGAGAGTISNPQPGLFMFTKKHYSITSVRGTAPRKNPAERRDPSARFSDAEKIAAFDVWNLFTANSGTYEVSGNTLTTRPMVAKNPVVMSGAAAFSWGFKIDGNTLTLTQKSAPGGPARETTTKLTRVE